MTNNLKINIANLNIIYKKNPNKIFTKIGSDKSNKNNDNNTRNLSKSKVDNKTKNIISNMNIKNSNDCQKSQRNSQKREILELKKISNTIDNVRSKNPERAKREVLYSYTKSHTPINIHNNYCQNEKEIFAKSKKLRENAGYSN